MSKIDSVKEHFKRNKDRYIIGAAGITVGAVAAVVIVKMRALSATEEVVNATTVIKQVNYKSNPIVHVTTHLERRGHPGNMVRCVETGEVFASQNRAAEVMDLSASKLSRHLNNMMRDVDGYHFENLGEAA